MLAEAPPSMALVRETRPRVDERSSAAGPPGRRQALDDWLVDGWDDDWSETAAEPGRGRGTPASQMVSVEGGRRPAAERLSPARPVAAAEAHRAVVERRRFVAGAVLVAILGVAAITAVLLLRGGSEAPATASQPVTTTAPEATGPSSQPAPPPPSTTPTPPPPAPTTTDASAFALPEGTKLQRGENDEALVEELQRALARAGYDPGPADGTYGRQTEAAVVAFQQDNGLSVDGRVGPETAAALSSAAAAG